MREVRKGVWCWQAVHPQWTLEDATTEDWGPEVSSYAIDDGQRLLLIDPVFPPSPVDELVAARETMIVLTCPWHERDARTIVERSGASVFSPAPDGPTGDVLAAQRFVAGDRLPLASRRSRAWSRTISCCGSRAAERLSRATR